MLGFRNFCWEKLKTVSFLSTIRAGWKIKTEWNIKINKLIEGSKQNKILKAILMLVIKIFLLF